ncbi:hypothetical protein HPB48_011408 [Haemaphysalis longicornis]|uniref:Peptidyl-tRNA hydrolase ICT1, mitochondrial n=1 Tax=Haemaphysalis longicornis TaxID=44386 RepID=A0A9J6FTG9_HAELO|nr:hypothetical protein HPB48_011408 [Haemaphysalis longicornis]
MAALRRLLISPRPSSLACCRSYKSSINLETLYPDSKNVEIPTGQGVPMSDVKIYDEDPSNPFRVEVRVHLDSAQWISPEAKNRLRLECKPYIDSHGHLVLASDRTRKKSINVADCLDKLRCMLREVSNPPPEKIPETRFTLRAKHERLAAERLRVPRAAESLRNS